MLHQSQDRGSALTFLPFLFNQLRRSLQVSCKSCEKSSMRAWVEKARISTLTRSVTSRRLPGRVDRVVMQLLSCFAFVAFVRHLSRASFASKLRRQTSKPHGRLMSRADTFVESLSWPISQAPTDRHPKCIPSSLDHSTPSPEAHWAVSRFYDMTSIHMSSRHNAVQLHLSRAEMFIVTI